jgi:hypothetical protein
MRTVGPTVIVARPRDGAPVVMPTVAARIWRGLDRWTTTEEIDRDLAQTFPEVPDEERVAALQEILTVLHDEDLVERG